MKLSVVVGTYNRLDQIERCVESIQRETSVPYHLYITDGGSTDGTIEYLQSIESEVVRPIFVGRLVGQAKAYNDVFDQLTTPYVCWLSDDNVIVNRGLDTALSILQTYHDIGMVGLKTKDIEGPFVKAPYIGGISEAGILNVNQGMLPTSVMHDVGGFSEVFQNYGIDPDLTAKVLFSGFTVAYTQIVAIHHYRNWEMDETAPEHKTLMEKHDRSRRLYRTKYSEWVGDSRSLRTKRRVFGVFKDKVGGAGFLDSTTTYIGAIPRDWYNALNGKFIRGLDPIICANRAYHLVQRCPKRWIPESLPAEPEEEHAGAAGGRA